MKIAHANPTLKAANTWTLRLFTLLVWAAVGLCAAYWAFKFVTTKPVEATAAIATPAVVVDSKAVAKLLGATDNIASQAINTLAKVKLSLFGLATSPTGHGVALIATDDKPAKPYRVGAKVTDDLVLKSISKVDATLATSSTAPDGQKLELPSRKPATFVASSTPAPSFAPAQLQAPTVNTPANNVANVANAMNNATNNAAAPSAAPNYANTVGTLNPALAESLRPISRFANRAPGAAVIPSNPGVPVQAAPVNTLNPAAAANSAASSMTDSVAR